MSCQKLLILSHLSESFDVPAGCSLENNLLIWKYKCFIINEWARAVSMQFFIYMFDKLPERTPRHCRVNNDTTSARQFSNYQCSLESKNIERGRNPSCYIALCAKSVGNITTVTDRQLFHFGNLWFYTFIKDICLEKCYSIYLVKIIQQSIHKMWKNNNIILQLNQWKLCVGYPQTVHDPSCCWQHKSCYSNILLVCLSWLGLYN